ncbi:unnamed protein product [Chrysodeixis includens]|uniref:unspecific monooxygenase n=1 Tax=Chrysodeixis includens TaxID=689277 RepID=A0A9P0BQM1_CHRIL|nr:unnamed protein product [Chrysodeixis includens]
MPILIPLLIIVCSLCYYYCTKTFSFWKDKNVKGPKPMPLFGNFLDVFMRRKHVGVLYDDLYKEYKDEKVVGLFRMISPTLLVRDLDIVKQVLIKDFELLPDRGLYYSKEALGDNLFHATYDVSKTVRKHVTSIFTSRKFRNNFDLFVDRADKFMDYLEEKTMKKPEFDVLPVFRKYAVDSIMIATCGMDVRAYDDDNPLCDFMDAQIQTPTYFIEIELLFPGTLAKWNLSAFPKSVRNFCKQVVRTGVANVKDDSLNQKNNLIDVIAELRKDSKVAKEGEDTLMDITEDMLIGQVFIFYFAGYGNNSLLTTYALYHLAKNPEAQDKLIAEIDEILEKYDGKLTYDAFKEMKYLQMVFDETIRMHPLTNSITRNVRTDVKIEGMDLVIPKDTIVVVSPYAIQHDEKYYPEPEKFEPERFSPENVRQRHPCALVSFGAGPRSCLGSRYALLQFGICIAKLLSKYRVEPTENTVKTIDYTAMRLLLTPSDRIYLRLVRRDRQ